MRVLVTGANGHIGANVVRALGQGTYCKSIYPKRPIAEAWKACKLNIPMAMSWSWTV